MLELNNIKTKYSQSNATAKPQGWKVNMCQTETKQDFEVNVLSNTEAADGFWKMKVYSPGVKFAPGQFFQISVPGHSLRRPFAPCEADEKSFSFVYQIVGEGTKDLSKMTGGDSARVIAPLGNGFKLPSSETTAILVGGGCGTPSLCILAAELKRHGNTVLSVVGARSACTLLETANLRYLSTRLFMATDDGTIGFSGNAVDCIRKEVLPQTKGPVEFFACGPTPMLKALSLLAAEEDVPCQVSLEERMACGFGACMGCAVKVKADNDDGFVYRRVCHEGPVFYATELVW